MAKMIFDKGLDTEKTLTVSTVYERIIDNVLQGVYNVKIEEGEMPDIPELNKTFTSIEVQANDGVVIPHVCTYNNVQDFNTSYSEETKEFSYNVNLNKVEE